MKTFYLITELNEIEELTGLNHEEQWDSDLNLDDWDYFIFIPTDKDPDNFKGNFQPKDPIWNRLLSGCCSNDWVHIKSPKGNFYIGGAYHS